MGVGSPSTVAVTVAVFMYSPTGTTPVGIRVEKFLNGQRETNPNSPILVAAGSTNTYTYQVTTTTSSSLSNITIVDDNGTPGNTADDLVPTASTTTWNGATYNTGDTNHNGLLDPGETWLYSLTRVAAYGPYANVVRVSGDLTTASGTTTVLADDINYSLGVTPRIRVVKAVDALDPWHPTSIEDANTQPARELLVGTTAVWTYLVTNTGNAPVTMTSIVDNNGTPTNPADDFVPQPVTVVWNGGTYNAGDTNHNGLLDVGETWLFRATSTVMAGAYQNTAVATVQQPTTLQTATGSDVAGYYGELTGSGLTPGFWKNHPQAWPTTTDGSYVFDPNQLLSSVFGPFPSGYATETLMDAVSTGGGGIDALMRAAVSALLNSTDPYLAYPQTATWIVQAVDAALASGDATTINNLQTQLDTWNNLEGSLAPPP